MEKHIERAEKASKPCSGAVKRAVWKPIETEAFVEVGGELVNTKDLDDIHKKKLAEWLSVTYMNEIFRGRAVFHVE